MTGPRVSVVLALDELETGLEALAALAAQTIAADLEVILVGPRLDASVERFPAFGSVVCVDRAVAPLADARAAGILRAGAPFVFVAETHGLPRPECLEQLVAACEAGADAAMPRFLNANPETARSWASLFATYAAFTGTDGGGIDGVSLHNGLFRRGPLAAVAAERSEGLVYGVGVSAELRRHGGEMVFVPTAEIDHLNVTRVRSLALDRFAGARIWAGSRARLLSPVGRAARILAFPLVPLLFLRSVTRTSGWSELRGARPRGTSAVLVLGTLPIAAGEALGYALGVGAAARQHVDVELHRRAHL